MDANGKVIPFVDDDQGEGIKDFIDRGHEAFKAVAEALTQADRARIFDALHKDKPQTEMLADIVERLDRLEARIKFIFDGHVLIDGKWRQRKITP